MADLDRHQETARSLIFAAVKLQHCQATAIPHLQRLLALTPPARLSPCIISLSLSFSVSLCRLFVLCVHVGVQARVGYIYLCIV